jgi:NADPH-dependent curcumin reductase CurA
VLPTNDTRACHKSQLDPKGMPLEGAMAVMNLIIGVTAWAGIREILGMPKGEGKDKVVCVSGASGAVGLVACQIAKADGAKVIGIAGKEPTLCVFGWMIMCILIYVAGDCKIIGNRATVLTIFQ